MGHVDVSRMLVKAGSNVSYASPRTRCTPFHHVVRFADQHRNDSGDAHDDWDVVAQMLIDHGVDLNCVDHEGMTPLGLACELGLLEIVRAPVIAGAYYNLNKIWTSPGAMQ